MYRVQMAVQRGQMGGWKRPRMGGGLTGQRGVQEGQMGVQRGEIGAQRGQRGVRVALRITIPSQCTGNQTPIVDSDSDQ